MTCQCCEKLSRPTNPNEQFLTKIDGQAYYNVTPAALPVVPNPDYDAQYPQPTFDFEHYLSIVVNAAGKPFLYSYASADNYEADGEEVVAPIKFCPLCGRKLTD